MRCMNAIPRTEAENDAAAEASAEAEGKKKTTTAKGDPTGTVDPADKAGAAGSAEKGTAAAASKRAAAPDTASDADTDGAGDAAAADDDADFDLADEPVRPVSGAIGAGVAAVVSAGLAFTALTGTWSSQILGEREKLDNQLHLSQSSAVKAQIEGLYADGWHVTALVNGAFALLALLVGVGALIALRPVASAAYAAVTQRPVWMRAVAWAGVILAVVGLLVSVGMYLDLFASIPTPPAAPQVPQTPPS